MKKRILFTTHVGRDIRYFEYAMPHQLLSLDFHFPAMGLHFLRENVEGIEILEFPSWEKYQAELIRGVDILGISFYTKDIPIVERMVKLARERYGVREIWGGNYGVLNPGMTELFDRVFLGYAEEEVYLAVHGREREWELRHPVLVTPVTAPFFPMLRAYAGIIFTHRGCPLHCTFCQTPVFSPQVSRISRRELARLVEHYHKIGIHFILFAEENFTPAVNRDLLDRLAFYGMQWYSQSRADLLHNHIHELVDKTGYTGSLLGIESMNDRNLEFLNKRESINTIIETLNEAKDSRIFMQGTYMFGYEDDTPETLEEDTARLAELPLLVNHYFVLTPYPQTELARYIERKFGTPNQEWALYDSRHLVWNHPHISPREMNRFVDRVRSRGWGISSYIRMGLRTLRLFGHHIRLT